MKAPNVGIEMPKFGRDVPGPFHEMWPPDVLGVDGVLSSGVVVLSELSGVLSTTTSPLSPSFLSLFPLFPLEPSLGFSVSGTVVLSEVSTSVLSVDSVLSDDSVDSELSTSVSSSGNSIISSVLSTDSVDSELSGAVVILSR